MMRQPTIEWQTNGLCNYACSYCIQSSKYRQGHPTPTQIEQVLHFFSQLPGTWEIKMSGGEPFAFKGFLDQIIPGLARLSHHVSVLTNLSAPLPALRRFVDLVGDQLMIVSTSLHREYTTPTAFLEKAVQLRQWLRPETVLVVNSVLVPGTLPELLAVKQAVEAAGLTYFPQLMKTKQGVYPYSPEDQAWLSLLLGPDPTPKQANLAPNYQGYHCWSGVDYFVLDQKGNAWSCRTAKRGGEGYLGNVWEGGVRLLTDPQRCPYTICPCTVPANRGMISRESTHG